MAVLPSKHHHILTPISIAVNKKIITYCQWGLYVYRNLWPCQPPKLILQFLQQARWTPTSEPIHLCFPLPRQLITQQAPLGFAIHFREVCLFQHTSTLFHHSLVSPLLGYIFLYGPYCLAWFTFILLSIIYVYNIF